MNFVLIPAYEPESVLIELVKELKKNEFNILVVDDGSGENFSDVFAQVKAFATVVTLPKNCGKGAALKAGMKYIKENFEECENVITCDADGQHKVEDVIRVRERLLKGDKFVLTVRKPRKGIPFRSKFGNSLSRFVYTLLTNRFLSDNQSGLRGFNKEHLDWLIEVEKNNYDYEMNVLYYASKKGIKISTIPIEAIYIENNQSSHFNPVLDTLRIYKSLFKLARATFITLVLTEVLIIATSIIFGYEHLMFTIPGVAAIGYATTALLNKYIFFRKTNCYDYINNLVYTIMHNIFYFLGCLLFSKIMPMVPLIIAFNVVFLVCIPLRYWFHKYIFIASQTRE